MFNLTPMVKNLLLINVAVFLGQVILQLDFPQLLGLRYFFAETFQPYQLITHIFVHSNGMHLFSNMFALIIFGPMLEYAFGQKRFLFFYLLTGYGASTLYGAINFWEISAMHQMVDQFMALPSPELLNEFIVRFTPGYEYFDKSLYEFAHVEYPSQPLDPTYIASAKEMVGSLYYRVSNTPMVGASGAVFGILMGFGMLFPNTQLMLLFPPIPIKAKYLVALYGAYEIYSTIQNRPDDNVAHFAHIGGMIFAFIILKYWDAQSHR